MFAGGKEFQTVAAALENVESGQYADDNNSPRGTISKIKKYEHKKQTTKTLKYNRRY